MVNTLRITITYIEGERFIYCNFVPYINEYPKKPETIKITKIWNKITQEQIDDLYSYYSKIGSEIQKLKSVSDELISHIVEEVFGENTLEKLKTLGSRIYRKAFPDPFKEYLKKEQISTITINATEFKIPFELMFDDERNLFLAAKIAFYRIPFVEGQRSITPTDEIKKKTPYFVLFANPTNDLTASQVEAENIIDFLDRFEIKCKDYYTDDITCKLIINTMDRQRLDVFHYTGHSTKNKNDIFFKLEGNDFSIEEVSLRYPSLFFLNMCESDLKIIRKNDNQIAHFPSEIMRQGAKACIATLWPIIETTSAKFAIQFYEQIYKDGKHFGDAICKTKADLIKKNNPYDITPMSFILYGIPEHCFFTKINEKQPVYEPEPEPILEPILIPKIEPNYEKEQHMLLKQIIDDTDLPSGLSFLYSCSSHQPSWNLFMEGRINSVFSYALLKGLNELSRPITFGNLYYYIKREVKEIHDSYPNLPPQTPIISASRENALNKTFIGDIPTRIGHKWALLIGINEYRDDSIMNLEHPERDVLELREILYNSGEFENGSIKILTGSQATNYNILDKLDMLLNQIQPKDTLIFYYQGHGGTIEERGYIFPHDTNRSSNDLLKVTSIPLDWIIEGMEHRDSHLWNVFFIVDSNRSAADRRH